jgi:hypothetical protein
MSFNTFTDFNNELKKQRTITLTPSTTSLTSGRPASYYRAYYEYASGAISTIPSTATACNKTDTFALNNRIPAPPSGKSTFLIGANFNYQANPGLIYFIDRLSHNGGISGTSTGTITTNLPTAALPRFTDGVGVYIGIEIYTTIGATATTISATYTNQAGTGSRTTPNVVFGGGGFNTLTRFLILPLADGDTGVKSVESLSVAATTGTAGNYGVTLFKMLGAMSFDGGKNAYGDIVTGNMCGMPDITNACLSILFMQSAVTAGINAPCNLIYGYG